MTINHTISQTVYRQHTYADISELSTPQKDCTQHFQPHENIAPAAEITISEEGKNALREKLEESGLGKNWTDTEVHGIITSDIFWEHYNSLLDAGAVRGNSVEEMSRSIMDAYETVYGELVRAHENGDRPVSYESSSIKTVTLEEDLVGLNNAFEMCQECLNAFIVCQQVNKTFEHTKLSPNLLKRLNFNMRPQDIDYTQINHVQNGYRFWDDEYRNDAWEMLQQARNEFLTLFKSPNYTKGMAGNIISRIINSNTEFVSKTKLLFPERA